MKADLRYVKITQFTKWTQIM